MSTPGTDGANILDPIEFYHSGATAFFASQRDQRFCYCLYVPQAHQNTTVGLPLVVIVHGTQRAAERYRDAYRDFAEQHGCVVLAPLFPAGITEPGDLHGFKRIQFHDVRFDRVLLDIVDEVGERYRVGTERFCLHGFSGGGQFAHRFAYLHPHRLAAVSIGAPGRVTRIDPDHHLPGVRPHPRPLTRHDPARGACEDAVRLGGSTIAGGLSRPILADAGLRVAGMAVTTPVTVDPDAPEWRYYVDTVASVLPLIIKHGIATEAEVGIDTLLDRLRGQARDTGTVAYPPELVGAWAVQA